MCYVYLRNQLADKKCNVCVNVVYKTNITKVMEIINPTLHKLSFSVNYENAISVLMKMIHVIFKTAYLSLNGWNDVQVNYYKLMSIKEFASSTGFSFFQISNVFYKHYLHK